MKKKGLKGTFSLFYLRQTCSFAVDADVPNAATGTEVTFFLPWGEKEPQNLRDPDSSSQLV